VILSVHLCAYYIVLHMNGVDHVFLLDYNCDRDADIALDYNILSSPVL
jgi:hypothetical protein